MHFSLRERESVAIVGASGSGKSTLLSIVAGLDVPTRGTVRLDGIDIFKLDEDARAAVRAERVGFVFQSFQLLANLTALENVMLPLELQGRSDARSMARDMLERVGLGERLSHYPKVLSGGEQQRVALAQPRGRHDARARDPRQRSGQSLRPADPHRGRPHRADVIVTTAGSPPAS